MNPPGARSFLPQRALSTVRAMLNARELADLAGALAHCGPAISDLPLYSSHYKTACDQAAHDWLAPVVEGIVSSRLEGREGA